MKILSAIPAILILFLTMQSVLINADFITDKGANAVDKCCTGKQDNQPAKKQQEKDKNCCNDGHCNNPFLTCSNCYFINRDESSFSFVQVLRQSEKIRLINDNTLSSYIQDFWHPPEIV